VVSKVYATPKCDRALVQCQQTYLQMDQGYVHIALQKPATQYPACLFASNRSSAMPGWSYCFPSLLPCPRCWLGRCSVPRGGQEEGHSWLGGTAGSGSWCTSWLILLSGWRLSSVFFSVIPVVLVLPCWCLQSYGQLPGWSWGAVPTAMTPGPWLAQPCNKPS